MDLASMDLQDLDIGTTLVDRDEQQREEWFRLRAGKFTCSRFGDLTGSGRRKDELWSQTAMTYIYQVAAERLGSWCFEFASAPTTWGKENESAAIADWCKRTGSDVDQLVTGTAAWHEWTSFAGGTPDALVGIDGCLEVKCPYTPQEHMRYVAEAKVPEKYEWQVIGHLLVTGRDWCDFVSYDPRMQSDKRLFVYRTTRESVKAKIDWLADRLNAANEVVESIIK